jgi:PKD repeat protein
VIVAQKAIVLSEEDAAILQQMINKVKRDTPAARQLAGGDNDYLTSETYLAAPPAGGIPGAVDGIFGSADCAIYRAVENVPRPTGLTKAVYNGGPTVAGGLYVLVTRDKYGTWYVVTAAGAGRRLTVYNSPVASLFPEFVVAEDVSALAFSSSDFFVTPGGAAPAGGFGAYVNTSGLTQNFIVTLRSADGVDQGLIQLNFRDGLLATAYDPNNPPTTTGAGTTTTGAATTTTAATTTVAATTTAPATTTQAATTTTQALGVTASATPTSGNTPLAVNFSCSPGGGNPASYSYSWTSTPPGGTIGSTQNFTYSYLTAGTYDVVVTVTDASSNTATSNHLTITVTTASGPTITGASPASVNHNIPSAVTISGTGFTGVTAVKFGSVNAGSYTVNSATSITATPASGQAAGSYPITVTTGAGTSNAFAFSLT